jgi:hypothetical protein
MALLSSMSADRSMTKRPFADVVYEMLMAIYGSRMRTEQVMFDLLYTVKMMLEVEIARFRQFARFLGLYDPLPIGAFHFYLHTVAMMNRAVPGPLFPAVLSADQMISGIAAPAACAAGQKIFERFASGRTLKYYTERLNKIAGDGMMRFGGKNLAEVDQVLDYLLSAYVDECLKLDEEMRDEFAALPDREVKTFSQFHAMLQTVKPPKPLPADESRMMRELIACERIGCVEVSAVLRRGGFNLPFVLEAGDFLAEQNYEDVLKFMHMELAVHAQLYEELVQRSVQVGDEVMGKQLKSARAKFDQALVTHSLGRTFQTAQREFYEKLFLVELALAKAKRPE